MPATFYYAENQSILLFRLLLAGADSLEKNQSISSAPHLTSGSVSLPRFANPRDVSGKPQTMSGLFSVSSITASQTI